MEEKVELTPLSEEEVKRCGWKSLEPTKILTTVTIESVEEDRWGEIQPNQVYSWNGTEEQLLADIQKWFKTHPDKRWKVAGYAV